MDDIVPEKETKIGRNTHWRSAYRCVELGRLGKLRLWRSSPRMSRWRRRIGAAAVEAGAVGGHEAGDLVHAGRKKGSGT